MRLVKSAALLLTVSSVAAGQDPGRGNISRRGGQVVDAPQRGQMMVRQQIERLVRSEVRPTEAQMTQLRALDRRFERERGQLNQEEIAARRTLRDLMIDTVNVDQAKIEAAHNQLIKFPGRRAQLMEAEQKELATILTPLQRAKYWSIQEQVRRTIERGRGGRPPEGRGGPPPPPSTKRP